MSRPAFGSPAASFSSATAAGGRPPLSALSQRLTTATTLLLERERVVRTLHLPANASTDAQIVRALTFVRDGLARWADEADSEGGEERERLEQRYDEAVEMMEGQDEMGRLKVKGLKREKKPEVQRAPSPLPEASSSTSSPRRLQPAADDRPFRDSPSPEPGFALDAHSASPAGPSDPLSRMTPTRPTHSSDQPYADRPFAIDSDEEEDDPRGILGAQQTLMEEQDDRLAQLSTSIAAQTHLSRQIGSELDLHHQLLEETDEAMDRTSARMRGARKRLDKVGRGAKEHGSLITIVVLIVILLLLIVVFKT